MSNAESVSLSVYLPVFLFVSVCLLVCVCICLSVCVPVCLFVCRAVVYMKVKARLLRQLVTVNVCPALWSVASASKATIPFFLNGADQLPVASLLS